MGRHSRWHGLLVAGALALAAAQTVQAAPVPGVTVPQVSVPSVPQVPAPSVPQVSAPSVPQVSAPSVPQVSVPQVVRPAVPQVARNPLSNVPAPMLAQQRAVAERVHTAPRAASGGSSSVPAPSGVAPRPAGDRKARTRRARRAGRETSSKRLRRLLEPLAACVARLKPLQERVLVRRAGLRGFKARTRRELATILDTSRARIGRIERRALHNLRREVRAGGCTTPASSGAAHGTSGAAGTSGTLVADRVAAPAQSDGGRATMDRVAVKGVAESKSSDSMVDSVASAGRHALATIGYPARSYIREHPLTLVLALLATGFCAVLFARELRRPA